jgi:hypothetical protein
MNLELRLQINCAPCYKSRPERQIADLLDRYGLPFIYEKPTAVMDDGKLRTWYPDFSLRYGILIEYFGINGDLGYQERTRHKLKVYNENQFDVIPVYPRDMSGSWEPTLLGRINATLERRLSDYRTRIVRGRSRAASYSQTGGY